MTPKQRNAITWLCSAGYKPMMGSFMDMRAIKLTRIDGGEVEVFNISDVVADYDVSRRDDQRMRQSEKRARR